ALYLFIPATGESRLLAYGDRARGSGSTGNIDPNDPNSVYYQENNSANPAVYRCTYNAAAGHYAALTPNYTGAPSPNYSCSNITSGAGNDLMSQIARVVPGFDATYFNRVSSFGPMAGKYAGVTVQLGQNSIGYECWFDVTQSAGSQITACVDSWSRYPKRWAGMHGVFVVRTSTGWGQVFANPLNVQGGTGIGLYQLSINSIFNNGG